VLNRWRRASRPPSQRLGKSGTIKKLFAGINAGLSPLSRVPGQMVKGFAQIGVAAAPAFKRITTATGGVFDRISKQVDTAAKNGHLEKIIDQAFNIAKQIGHVIGDIFGTVGNIMKAAGKAGGDALGSIGSIFKELRKITAMPEVQKALTSIFKALSDVGKLLAGALGQAIQAMLPLLAQLAPFVSQLAKQLGPVVGQLLNGLGKALTPIISALLPVLSDVGGMLVGLVKAVCPC
jgi:phage-related protein